MYSRIVHLFSHPWYEQSETRAILMSDSEHEAQYRMK